MSIYRSYFEKNTTLIYDSELNTSQNEVFELVFGKHPDTEIRIFSRYIFKVDLSNMIDKLNEGYITQSMIQSHTLKIYNCIATRNELVGKNFYDHEILRASDFDLILFEVPEDWSEGTGKEFVYSTRLNPKNNTTPANWIYRKEPDVEWTQEGVYTGTPLNIISTIHFDKGNENIDVDISNYINSILFSGATNNGLGLAFAQEWEEKDVFKRYGVSFFSKYTNTFYEPYVETVFNDLIIDDRNEFYLEKENNLILYSYIGGSLMDLDNIPTQVELLDQNNESYAVINDVTRVCKGTYKVTFALDASEHPDMVKHKDVWKGLSYNGVTIPNITQEFTLMPFENYYKLNDREQANQNDILFIPANFSIEYNGIKNNERISRGDVRRIIVSVRNRMYQDSVIYLDNIQYRIYVKQGTTEIEVIPFTSLNKSNRYFFFDIDTSWMIPNHYYIQLKLKRNNLVDTRKELFKFIIANELK